MKIPLLPRLGTVEKYLRIPKDSFDHLPHYAREQALCAIQRVRSMEREGTFRPAPITSFY
jgi:hypothetical protein